MKTRFVRIDVDSGEKLTVAFCRLTKDQLAVLYEASDYLANGDNGTMLNIEDEAAETVLPDLKTLLDHLQQKCDVSADICKAIAEGNKKFKFPENPDNDYY